MLIAMERDPIALLVAVDDCGPRHDRLKSHCFLPIQFETETSELDRPGIRIRELTLGAKAQDDLESPVRITANGAPIDVTTGHAAPYFIDFDGDGVRDLLVGEYGEHEYPDHRMVPSARKYSGGFVEGRLRIYRNHGTDKAPEFRDFEYLRAGKEYASIPST